MPCYKHTETYRWHHWSRIKHASFLRENFLSNVN